MYCDLGPMYCVLWISKSVWHLIHMYRIWFLKNQVRQTWFFTCIILISKLIVAGYTGSKTPVWNRLKIRYVELDFSNLIFQKPSTDENPCSVLLTETCFCSGLFSKQQAESSHQDRFFKRGYWNDMGTIPLLICTWILKNQVRKIRFDELDF